MFLRLQCGEAELRESLKYWQTPTLKHKDIVVAMFAEQVTDTTLRGCFALLVMFMDVYGLLERVTWPSETSCLLKFSIL